MNNAVAHSTLIEYWGIHSFVRKLFIALAGSLFIWVSAKIQVPFYPVPITLQTFVILSLGMAFGWRWGGLTVLIYLIQGASGLPVFAGTPEKGIGIVYMVGPTGGYLVGFVLAAMMVGYLAEKRRWDRNPFLTTIAMVIGNIIIYAAGLFWLGNLMGWDKPILEWGLYPFLLGDVLKILLAALILPLLWKLKMF